MNNGLDKIKKEYKDMHENPMPNTGTTVSLFDEQNIKKWRITLIGPWDTSYKGGLFVLSIEFPNEYPQKPPEICFITPIYHVNVNPNAPKYPGDQPLGHVSISTLNRWNPIYSIREVLHHIYILLYNPNPYSPYGLDRADECRNRRDVYEEKIRLFTRKYANLGRCNKTYPRDQNWDFS